MADKDFKTEDGFYTAAPPCTPLSMKCCANLIVLKVANKEVKELSDKLDALDTKEKGELRLKRVNEPRFGAQTCSRVESSNLILRCCGMPRTIDQLIILRI